MVAPDALPLLLELSMPFVIGMACYVHRAQVRLHWAILLVVAAALTQGISPLLLIAEALPATCCWRCRRGGWWSIPRWRGVMPSVAR